MAELISVIIPAYNAEKFIERCLSSVLGQSYRALEVIVVDDGSGDNTAAEVNRFVDERLSLLRLPSNCGQSVARNTGLAVAKGEYIGFVDADDFIDNDFYERLISEAKRSNADIVMADTRYLSADKVTESVNGEHWENDMPAKIAMLNHGGPCDKLYKASLIHNNGIRFLEGRIWEDNLFVIQALSFAGKMASVTGTYYNYELNENSTVISAEKEQKRREDSLFVAAEIMNFAQRRKMSGRELGCLKDFIINNFISRKFLTDSSYYRVLCGIIGKTALLKKCRRKALRRWLIRISFKRKKLVICGRNILGKEK